MTRVGITAGESANPRKAVPRAISQVFWRILIFYIGMMFFIGILIPYTDSRLIGKGSKTASSPLTIAMGDANIKPAAHLINGLIVISVISAGNSALYVSSRTIVHMAHSNMAPLFLGKTNKAGVPWAALIFSNVCACIAFLSQSSNAGVLYEALITLSGVATFIVWAVIELVHIRFRQAMKAQNQSIDALPFKALFYPYGTYLCLAANVFLIFFQGRFPSLGSTCLSLTFLLGYTAFLNPFSAQDFVINYILLPVFILLFLAYKFWNKTKFVKLDEMDIYTGRRDDLMPETEVEEVKERSIWYRVKNFVVG